MFVVDTKYTDLRPIGGGSYGFVCSAMDTQNREKVAIKKIANVFHDLVDAKRILREIKLLRHFKYHENIISAETWEEHLGCSKISKISKIFFGGPS